MATDLPRLIPVEDLFESHPLIQIERLVRNFVSRLTQPQLFQMLIR